MQNERPEPYALNQFELFRMLYEVELGYWCAVMSGRKRVIRFVVLALALTAIVCAVRAARYDPYGLDARSRYVCVATGELFDLSADEAGMVPARNPHSGEWTLLPCKPGDGDRLHVGERYRPMLTERLSGANRHVDPRTLAVR